MADSFKYILMGIYIGLTYWLSVRGMRKAKSLEGFSISNKDLSPFLVGITMAASVASSATFVINPGFVYTHGMSAYIHYGVAGMLGIAVAFLTLCKGFRKFGDKAGSLTIPDWIYGRYGSRALATFFAAANMLSITFVVLILVGCAILTSGLFGIDQKLSLTLILLFVFSYVLMGGAYAHAYTNALQGVMMVFISIVVFSHGIINMEGGFFASIAAQGDNYAAIFNPDSELYFDFFSVFLSGFIITFALMMQPHILTKTLYLKSGKDVNRFLATALITGAVFTLMLFVGFFAKTKGMEIEAQDEVTAIYINEVFGGSMGGQLLLAFITVALLAAGMSTLDGILVALSAMVVNDLVLPFSKDKQAAHDRGLKLSRYVLVGVGLFAFAIAWNPPELVGLFAQTGVYGLAATSFVPITFGVLSNRKFPAWLMGLAAFLGLGIHLYLNKIIGGQFTNPSVSSSWAIIASTVITTVIVLATPKK
ncbi:MAG: sodium:solute symporter family protein [Acidobacteriota bacterium]|nr:sodium:solute symporter family protein [Acidobacteriota bacterium]